MIRGAHLLLYSRDAEADRAFFRDVLGWSYVDAHDGWLIFAQPPAELAVHPAQQSGGCELYLMCDDLEATVAGLVARGVTSGPVTEVGWGLVTHVRLPGGGELGLYEPRHPSPLTAFGGEG